MNSPVIIQFSNGGAQFIAGKGMPNDKMEANIAGASNSQSQSVVTGTTTASVSVSDKHYTFVFGPRVQFGHGREIGRGRRGGGRACPHAGDQCASRTGMSASASTVGA